LQSCDGEDGKDHMDVIDRRSPQSYRVTALASSRTVERERLAKPMATPSPRIHARQPAVERGPAVTGALRAWTLVAVLLLLAQFLRGSPATTAVAPW
jgi:hypothetical protein